jgi:hypothetical protein
MTCLDPERLVELLDRGGLDAVSTEEQAHLQGCDTCLDSWATVAAAGEVLTEARPRQAGRVSRLVPLLAAAAILCTIVGIIAAGKIAPSVKPPVQDPLTLFLQGTPEEAEGARATLMKSGRSALPGLVAARPKWKGSARFSELQNLIWTIKRDAAQDPAADSILNKLETLKIDLQFENTEVVYVLAFVRSLSGLNVVLDPKIDAGTVDFLSLKNSTVRSVLETLCAVKDLDFDVKYGVVFLSKPLRLWSTDPALGLPAANLWRTEAAGSGKSAVGDKLRSVRLTMDAQTSPLSAIAKFIQEISSVKVVASPGIADTQIGLKVEDVPLDHAIELLTLPYGWDARIDDGSVLLFNPKQ